MSTNGAAAVNGSLPKNNPSEEAKPVPVELRSRNRTRSTNLEKENQQELDQWQRNSLIMMTVAKSSPRNKTESANKNRAESPTVAKTQPSPTLEVMSKSAHEDLIFFPSRQNSQDPAPAVTRQDSTPKPLTHDGHYFLLLVDKTQVEIEQGIEKIEKEMAENKDSIHDDVMGALCTTVGMARLLLREKFAQFRGLCNLNIERINSGQEPDLAAMAEAPEKFASGDDLAGFWAMVNLQVDNVRKMFAEAEKFAENGWQPIAPRRHSVAVASRPRMAPRKPLPRPSITPVSEEAAAASEARNAALQEQKRVARERMLKMKQDMMAKRQQEKHTNGADTASGFMVI